MPALAMPSLVRVAARSHGRWIAGTVRKPRVRMMHPMGAMHVGRGY